MELFGAGGIILVEGSTVVESTGTAGAILFVDAVLTDGGDAMSVGVIAAVPDGMVNVSLLLEVAATSLRETDVLGAIAEVVEFWSTCCCGIEVGIVRGIGG